MGWLRERFESVVNHGVEWAIGACLLAALGFFWLHRSYDVHLPLWSVALIVAVVLVAVLLLRPRRGAALPGTDDEDVQRYLDYARHLYDSLETMQKVIRGTIPDVTFQQFMETGVLQPAREFLTRRPEEDVRLSVLMRDEESGDWRMIVAAGYRLESRQRFRLAYDASFSRHAYESREIQWSGDVLADQRFIPHPNATRRYHSLVSSPLFAGDAPTAVFNVDSTLRDAFDGADLIYISLIGSILDVVLSHMDTSLQEDEEDDARE